MNFDIVVSLLRTREVELKQEKRELERGDKKVNVDVLFTKVDQARKKMVARRNRDYNFVGGLNEEWMEISNVGLVKKNVIIDVIVWFLKGVKNFQRR